MLKITQMNQYYHHQHILKDINLEVEPGEILCILGASGAGKTTLLKVISGLLPLSQGKVQNTFKRIAYVFQEDRLLPWFTATENICLVNDALTETSVAPYLASVSLEGQGHKKPDQMSGGMRQRVSIARAYAYEPDLLLMDEPFKSIDIKLKKTMIDSLLKQWISAKMAIIVVTHDIDEAVSIADKILILGQNPTCILKEMHIEKPRQDGQETTQKMIRAIMEDV